MNPTKRDDRPPCHNKLTTDQKHLIFAHVLRNSALFMAAREQLEISSIPIEKDGYLRILWQAALNIAKLNGDCLPDPLDKNRIIMDVEVKAISGNYSFLKMDDRLRTELFGDPATGVPSLVDWIYSLPEDELNEDIARQYLIEYLREILLTAKIHVYSSEVGNKQPTNIDEFAAELVKRSASINTLGVSDSYLAGQGVQTAAPPRIPTGLDFIDEFLKGGQSPGQAYTVIAPTGGGKTTLGVMLAVRNAIASQDRHTLTGEPLEHHYYFTYEQPAWEIDNYVLSYLSEIDYDRLLTGFDLSDQPKSQEYERLLKISGTEKERYRCAVERLQGPKGNLWIEDFSGHPNPKAGKNAAMNMRGCGGVEEIAATLEKRRQSGQVIASVVVDYVAAALERETGTERITDYESQSRFNNYVVHFRKHVSSRFNSYAWILQQLKGAANNKAPTVAQHHSDARGARSFSDSADFAFTLGTRDIKSNGLLIACTKARFNQLKEPVVLVMDGVIRRLRKADDLMIDTSTRTIIPKSIAGALDPGSIKSPRGNNLRDTIRDIEAEY